MADSQSGGGDGGDVGDVKENVELGVCSTIKSPEELAEHLGVPTRALFCVEMMPGQECTFDPACPYPAVERNIGFGGSRPKNAHCIFHETKWYPGASLEERKKGIIRPGHMLLGPQYFRVSHNHKLCVCGSIICRSIGYTPHGVVIPSDEMTINLVAKALGLSEDLKEAIEKRPRQNLLAPWHFNPKYRQWDEFSMHFRLKKYRLTDTFLDASGTKWKGLPPCDYSLDDFVKLEGFVEKLLPRDKWYKTQTVTVWPSWIRDYRKAEEEIANQQKQQEDEAGDGRGKRKRFLLLSDLTSAKQGSNKKARLKSGDSDDEEEEVHAPKPNYEAQCEQLRGQVADLEAQNHALQDTVQTQENTIRSLEMIIAEKNETIERHRDIQALWFRH